MRLGSKRWAYGTFVSALASVTCAAGIAQATEHGVDDPLPDLFWGDTHVHSAYSLDANLFNNFTLGPETAYRFARGEQIVTGAGRPARLKRPLDFLVVSDHAEYMGVFKMIREGHPAVSATETAKAVRQLMAENPVFGPEDINALNALLADDPLSTDASLQRLVWDEVIDTAERMNQPGRFVTIVGYEWGSTPGGDNLHRNVLFRDGPDKTKTILPFSAVHSMEPEDLWAFLEKYERDSGGEAFAIPHNANLSNGRMFAVEDSNGQPFSVDYAKTRAKYEPILEVTQIKGDSETHPFLSPADEFADYERWDKTNIFGLARTEPEMHAGSYARAALKNGLLLQTALGVNPFKFGLIGSTDAHTSLATADEDNYWGKTSNMPPGSPNRTQGEFIRAVPEDAESTMNWEQAAAGYAGVWAKGHTRAEIFDAMRRGEVYSTTGPRMQVQFFGGWRFSEVDARASSPARAGYVKGVPMGGDLPAAPASAENAAPRFLILAAKDPFGANLQRAQVVKGWVGDDDQAFEQVYDVKVADDPTFGMREVATIWEDPDFDPTRLAFYYLRVLETPTPRWNAIDAARERRPLAVPRASIQERAYTSPIWYTPPIASPSPEAAAEARAEPEAETP